MGRMPLLALLGVLALGVVDPGGAQTQPDLQRCRLEATQSKASDPVLDLERHQQLNPALWTGAGQLRPVVAERLLAIAAAWQRDALIPDGLVSDVLLVGGNANYNYTSKSDIDVHLLVPLDRLGSPPSLVNEYIKTKTKSWSNSRAIRVAGYRVEVSAYANPIRADQGIYSLRQRRWLVTPRQQAVRTITPELRQQAGVYQRTIACLIRNNAPNASFETLLAELKQLRKAGLAQAGEFDPKNLLYKALRNSGDIDAIKTFLQARIDRQLSTP